MTGAYLTRDFGSVLELDSTYVFVASWQGKLEEAIELFKKALSINMEVNGDSSVEVAIHFSNLSLVYDAQAIMRAPLLNFLPWVQQYAPWVAAVLSCMTGEPGASHSVLLKVPCHQAESSW